MAAGAFVIVCKRSSFEAVGAALVAVAGNGLEQKSSLGAPRNAPLRTGRMPGAETALFLYHPYFSGAQRPDGERFNRRPSTKNVSAADFAPDRGDSPGLGSFHDRLAIALAAFGAARNLRAGCRTIRARSSGRL
jgi:hypothetical protein